MRTAFLCLAAGTLLLTSCSNDVEKNDRATLAPTVDPSLPVLGFIDVPAEGSTVRGQFAIGGWVIWGEGVQTLQFMIDDTPMSGMIQMGIPRPDVAKVHPEYQNTRSGWGSFFDTAALPAGKHKVIVQAKSNMGKLQNIGTVTLNILKP
jgi:hypothetical protein